METSKRGDGIARVKGFVIFVPNTKPGDKVKVKITRVGRSYAVAEITQEGAEASQESAEEAGTEEFEEESEE
ncbi:deoxyribonuclease [Vulcanisaeta moutnovskia 768-28]|uniref:Deoxyribonuclease n=1 Tax=Vulcanisaeta moutnovskia (strain 768-28) TaxID=985053 RepID=F0QSH3_VULM7|nr:deoxyribonuclease [Vulcanisaeta moutnovskia 768-28]